ncbi:putative peptidase membrane zinc metallopeptidase [Thermincola ferriacetica]|uniref:Putative peptidase membrane zinc metallopeptidase n=1 Tax=Thermincola ferriacetica TaxID=281456 RepID=A0A0L6W0X5_9FIRM|nr:zinc metallopeptidase [Thermincola ferriacetica]KNZ68734.1 putative peptidase membrane zinc metallopeptidase [Thermincola ferriacetica]
MIGFPFWDPTIIILIPGLLLSLYAQFKIQSTFARYLQVRSAAGITGAEAARRLLERARIYDVAVEMTPGTLSDHYDPRKKVLRLSPQVYNGTSLASLGVAAHEVGHAIQHDTGYMPLNIRAAFVPVVNIGSTLAFPLLILGLILAIKPLVWVGIYAFAAVVLFQLVTLPVELNASARAMANLEGSGLISGAEVGATRKVLDAAALTYVAAAVVSILQLVRLLAIAGFFRRDD